MLKKAGLYALLWTLRSCFFLVVILAAPFLLVLYGLAAWIDAIEVRTGISERPYWAD